jgi:hypothetical protein
MFARIAPERPTPPMPDETQPRRPAPTISLPTYEQIAARAHQIYLQNGCLDGESVQNWLQAERDLLTEMTQPMRFDEDEALPDSYLYESWELDHFTSRNALRMPSRIEAA